MAGLTKELISSNTAINQLQHRPVIREYETQRQEMIGIARQVQNLVAEGTAPGRIAIIYKENKYGEELAQYFKLLNVPVYSKRNLNLLQVPLAQKIILMLRYLAAEHDTPYGGDEMLFEILHFDWFGIPPIEIAKLSIEVADKKYNDERMSIRRALIDKANTPARDLFTPNLHPALQRAGSILEKLIGGALNLTLQQLFEELIRRAGVLASIMPAPDKHWQLQVLTGLFDFLKDENMRDKTLDLKGFIGLLELMEKEGIPLPLVQVSGNDKGVNLLTAHGSKGLEFEYVLLAGCNSSFWEKKRKPGGGYKLPDTMFSSLPASSDDEELRRLFYVALTRAEKHLYISYSKFRNDGKELEPSMFVAEITDEGVLAVEKTVIDADVMSEFAALHFGESVAPEIEKIEQEFVSRLLEKFVMNVTALNNYLSCPLEFYFKNLVRIPSPKNEATEFGSSIHYALERLFRKMQDSADQQFSSREEFIADFDWYMHRHRESFTREQFERRLEYGYEVLGNYYDRYIHSFNKIVAIERNIRNVIVNGVPIKGKLDKLEFDGKSVNIVDYKTGDPDKAIPKLRRPNDNDPNGGDYWRQAVFYKILVDNYEQKGWKAVSTEFDFIEPDKKKNYRRQKVEITAPDITTVTQQIVNTWQRIQEHDFYKGCGKDDCHWCNFVKTNNLAIALHELNEEETSDINE
jgi:DNA helicase-2/ATP-dependent DNA helicase PcrA